MADQGAAAPAAAQVPAAAAGILAALAGGKPQRETAYVQLLALAKGEKSEGAIAVAAACVGPTMVAVYGADVAVVDAAELQRASLVLCELFALEPRRLIAEYLRAAEVWDTPGNVVSAIGRKDPADLTRDDAMCVACRWALYSCQYVRGNGACIDAVGGDYNTTTWMTDIVGSWIIPAGPHAVSGAFLERLGVLLLDIFRNPQGASPLVLAGAAMATCLACGGRAEVSMTLLNAGMLEVMVEKLHEIGSPVDWASWRDWDVGALACSIFTLCWMMSTLELPTNKTTLLLESGIIHATISLLKAFELNGVGAIPYANAGGIWSSITMLSKLDLVADEARPIVKLLEDNASVWAFILANNVEQLGEVGWATASEGALVYALCFGKEESADYTFTQDMCTDVLTSLQMVFSNPILAPYTPVLPPFYLRPLLHLCISDKNKLLLVKSPKLTPLLTEALLLDPAHLRTASDPQSAVPPMHEATKAAFQQTAAECFLQLALFEPGRAMLSDETAALEALHALVDGQALSEEAKVSAHGALLEIEGRTHEPEPEREGAAEEGGHVMVSYQWDVQRTIERIVRSMQTRGYDVWFDLDMMKGSTMDAMSDAVDNAEVMLYAVTLAYKESGNCRLEANYAHQQELDMIPLLFERDYKPKGWLGLILGTRMYYRFYDAEDEDQAVFDTRIDQIIREVGDRGKPAAPRPAPLLSEGVPPALAPAPIPTARAQPSRGHAPAPAPAPTRARAPPQAAAAVLASARAAVVPAATPDRSFTPSMQLSSPAAAMRSLDDTSIIFQMLEREDKLRQEMDRMREAAAKERVSGAESALLQRRLEAVHAANLLSDEELYAVEDVVADGDEASIAALISLSAKLVADAAFARQLRRKYT